MSMRWFFLLVLSTACLFAIPVLADSQARVVRLSDVQGDVQISRATAKGYEKGFLNLPITQGDKVRTGEDGRAQVEFEDGSSVRITPNTAIEFPALSLRDSGAKVSTVTLRHGTAYVGFTGQKDDQFTVNFSHQSVALTRPAHLRIEMGDSDASLAVFKGDVRIQGPSGTEEVGKNRTATFDLLNGDKYALVKDLEEDPFDAWDKQQQQYQDRYASNNPGSYSSYSPYAYGVSDLNYYGNFISAPGYGTFWQPYFAGAGWDPFMSGAWYYNPGFGYSWVSAYPWGWVPYHYGTWVYVPSYGWGWQPGGSWAGLNTVPRISNPPTTFSAPKPPVGTSTAPVIVSRGPSFSGTPGKKVVVNSTSAGLGIPRGTVNNLAKLQQRVQQDGSATAKIHTAPVLLTPTYGGVYRSSTPTGVPTSPSVRTAPSNRPSAPAPRPAPAPRGGSVPHR
ncbi:MAG TPA: DUF6600 domain-containing protein [Terriglobales bacterium]|nr:DUF6600 domain-containing protein [Terriglobales bacterium]